MGRVVALLGMQLVVGAFGLSLHSPFAQATAEIDRQYSLETIGALRSWDNVDGLFADYVASAYKEYFSHQSRFRLQDLSKADSALTDSKIPYHKTIEDAEILGQLARSMRTQSMLRTKIQKEGPQYRFTLEWLHSPKMEILATETFILQEPGAKANANTEEGSGNRGFQGLGDIKGSLAAALNKLFLKVPFIGQVTGRDNSSVTVNIGAQAGVKKGDTFVVGTIDEVKKHPLLKAIVDWRVTQTGKLVVDQVDEALSFCRLVEEEEGRHVARFQKITQLIPVPLQIPVINEHEEDINRLEEPPHLGFGAVSLWTGSYSRQFSSSNGSIGNTGGGTLFGARGQGQLWFNREFFIDLDMGYGGYGYSQKDIATQEVSTSVGASGSIFNLTFDIGYTYLITGDFFGPKGWVKLGYNGTSYDLPISSTEFTAPYGVKSVFLGVGGDLPIRSNFGARVDFQFGIFNMASESAQLFGDISSSSNAKIFFGGYYRFKPRITFQAGIEIQGNGSDFESGKSLSNKTFTFMPTVLYYF